MPLRICFANQAGQTSFISEITEVSETDFWATIPKQGAILIQVLPGSSVIVTLVGESHALISVSRVLEVRRARLLVEMRLTRPDSWRQLANRASPRVTANAEAMILTRSDIRNCVHRPIPATVQDMSVSGARVRSRVPLAMGTVLVLKFRLPDGGDVAAAGVIVRLVSSRPNPEVSSEFGVRFLKMDETCIGAIEKYIHRQEELRQRKPAQAS